ncbi:unnamed protein product [Caretta caretta]
MCTSCKMQKENISYSPSIFGQKHSQATVLNILFDYDYHRSVIIIAATIDMLASGVLGKTQPGYGSVLGTQLGINSTTKL